jgi:hypothetical protein
VRDNVRDDESRRHVAIDCTDVAVGIDSDRNNNHTDGRSDQGRLRRGLGCDFCSGLLIGPSNASLHGRMGRWSGFRV